mmetsp:Transcript_13547/g.25477  ORF Transcript_13547/g.25477 Transcript_13547/m.25477 type:complete len:310 (+) Transcript_13547:62-991(+)
MNLTKSILFLTAVSAFLSRRASAFCIPSISSIHSTPPYLRTRSHPTKSGARWMHSQTTPTQQLPRKMPTSASVRLKASPTDLSVISATSSVSPAIQAVLVLSSIAILVGYHLQLFHKEFKQISKKEQGQGKTWRQYQADTREDWSRHVRDTEAWLYAIQSLRNAITAQTFLATTVLSLLTLITGRMWDILRSATVPSERRLLTVQLASIACTMLISSYQFLQGVRLMTHAGFMFPVKKNGTKVDKIMRQTQNCQWLGLRWMYISLGPIFWVVGGSRAFFVCALFLLKFFRAIDKEPESMGYEQYLGEHI